MFSLIRRKQRPLVPPLGNDLLTAKPQRDVFFAGLNYFDNTPLLFDRSESVHSIYYGGTGSGKSASMAFALEQAIHAGDNALVVDLKGLDYMLYAAMCSAAARCGIDPPIYLTSRFRMPTYLCPVMRYDWWKHGLAAHEKADALVAALGLDDALSHSWWADAAEELYAFIAEQVDPDEIDDFVKFFDMLELRKNDLPKALRNDTIHAIIKAKRLARVTMFNPPADCHPAALEHACNLQDLLRSDKQRLVFVSLDSVRTEKTASAIARFLGRALLLAADDLADQRSARLQVVFDEAQRALGPGFMDLVLTLSRSAGISFTAGFQDISVLRHRGIDYTALFDENTDLQFAFAAKGPEAIKRQVMLSGEKLEYMHSKTYTYPGLISHRSWSDTFRSQLVNRFSTNDILAVSADKQRFIFRATRNTDLCQLNGLPVMARLLWHISEEEFRRRTKWQWPRPCERTVICGQKSTSPRVLPPNVPIPPTGIDGDREKPTVLHPPRR